MEGLIFGILRSPTFGKLKQGLLLAKSASEVHKTKLII